MSSSATVLNMPLISLAIEAVTIVKPIHLANFWASAQSFWNTVPPSSPNALTSDLIALNWEVIFWISPLSAPDFNLLIIAFHSCETVMPDVRVLLDFIALPLAIAKASSWATRTFILPFWTSTPLVCFNWVCKSLAEVSTVLIWLLRLVISLTKVAKAVVSTLPVVLPTVTIVPTVSRIWVSLVINWSNCAIWACTLDLLELSAKILLFFNLFRLTIDFSMAVA